MKHVNIPLLLEPVYRDYIWGGDRLKPGASPIAELWAVHENNRVLNGRFSGLTLAQVTSQCMINLLGKKGFDKPNIRFPLLIKLLDCKKWLSLQVHPNDLKAFELEGPGQRGKTEAWYFIDAEDQAEILCGLKTATDKNKLESIIRNGKILDGMKKINVKKDQAILIPAGMIHALGPGLLVYEVQQSSDITYRVWDWDRPDNGSRPLHIEKSIAVTEPQLNSQLINPVSSEKLNTLINCDYFKLSLIQLNNQRISMDPAFESFQALTIINGAVTLKGATWELKLDQYQSALVPADIGHYDIISTGHSKILCAMHNGA